MDGQGKGFYVRLQDDGTPEEGTEFTPNFVTPGELDEMDLGENVDKVLVTDADDELKAAGDGPRQVIPTRGQM